MRLEHVLEGIDYDIRSKGLGLDREINKIEYDSRKIEEKDIFIAIKGFKTDGHKYIDKAIEDGAVVIVFEDNDFKVNDKEITLIQVKDSRKVLAQMASNYFGKPSEKIDIIGLTGTNGKTTSSYLLKTVLEYKRKKVGIIGTIGNIIDNELIVTEVTTPESLELQETFKEMIKRTTNIAVMEVSSHALDLNRVDEVEFQIGLFTNLSQDHMDYHKTIDHYFNSKLKLFHKTKHSNIINVDDKYGRRIVRELQDLKIQTLTYGIENEADIYATDIELSAKEIKYMLHTPKGDIRVALDIPGMFSVYNSLATAAALHSLNAMPGYDISLDDIKEGFKEVRGVKGRFEPIKTNRDFSVIIDFAHTPDALIKVLQTVKEYSKGRVVIVFGAGGDRDNSKREEMGEVVGKNADFAIVTSDNPRTENPEKIIDDILKGIEKTEIEYVRIKDRKKAIEYAVLNAKKDDIILITGKGHEDYIILGEKKHPFDERKIVEDALNIE